MNSCERIFMIASVACGIVDCCSEKEVAQLVLMLNYLASSLSTLLACEELFGETEEEENEEEENEEEEILFFGTQP